ncbi:MAG: substrate-binding domain-containing protein [Pseudomonadota bacterium]
MRFSRPLLMLFLALVFSLTARAETQQLSVHGSNTVGATLMPNLVEAWLKQRDMEILENRLTGENERLMVAADRTGNRIEVAIHAHGSGTAFTGLAAGNADLGMASRPIKDSEQRRLSHLGNLTESGHEVVVGLDGIAVVVHPENPLSQLNMDQLRKIFTGEIDNWHQLGGVNQPIQVYARDDRSGTYDTFKSLVLTGNKPLAANAQRYESNDQLSDDVATDPMGIGFTGLPSIREAKALSISEAGNAAILPNELSVATEDYALSRRLYLYTPYNHRPLLRELQQFVQSVAGQSQVARTGFVAQNIEPYTLPVNSRAPEQYRGINGEAQRLSLNFRFRPRAYRLDNKALQDIDRLVDFLSEHPHYQVLLAGFSDGAEEAPWRRHILSVERADYVASQLIKKGIVPKMVRGFGSTVQVASNDTEKGRDKNRRVEVWVR